MVPLPLSPLVVWGLMVSQVVASIAFAVIVLCGARTGCVETESAIE